jgi:hypothetical protein
MPHRILRIVALPALLAAPLVAQQPQQRQIVTVTAGDFYFRAPDSLRAGVITFQLINNGREDHLLTFVRVDSSVPLDTTLANALAGRAAIFKHALGGPMAAAGRSAQATLTLPAGRYLMLCYLHSPDGKAHIAQGMMHLLTVTGRTNAALASGPNDVGITMREYGYDVSTSLRPGPHVLVVKNAGAQLHEFFLLHMRPGTTLADTTRALEDTLLSDLSGGAAIMAPGQTIRLPVNIESGIYILVCFVSDTKDHRPHLAHGMKKVIRVTNAGLSSRMR